MRSVVTACALCAALALGSAPAQAQDTHGGPHSGNQYPYWYSPTNTQMPPTMIQSMTGPTCGFGVTLLRIGNLPGANARTYVRDPEGRVPESVMTGAYIEHAEMPYDAVRTGLHQNDNDLLLTRDGAFAYLAGDTGVERWPALTIPEPACD